MRLAFPLALAAAAPALGGTFDDGARAFEKKDYAAAAAAWRPLAEAGDPRSQYNLGLILERGLGGPRNEPEAARWYERSANQGYGPAQHRLAQMYAEGRGVAASPVHAYVWFTLAHQAHGEGGTARLIDVQREAIKRKLQPSQIAEADAIVLVWRPVRE